MDSRRKDGFDNAIYAAQWVSLGARFASRSPTLLTDDDCREYAKIRFAAGRAPWTVHTELSRLRHCLRWAARKRLIPHHVDVWVPQKGKPRARVLTPEEMRRLIASAGDPHIRVFIVLAVATGARHSAILDLTWARVDWAANTIQYDEDLPLDPMSKSWRKGRATVPMGQFTRAVLEQAFAGHQSDHVVEHGGRRLRTVRDGFANAVKRAGLDGNVTPHTIRHSVLTMLRERGLDFHRIATLAGHTDSRTTELNYTHVDVSSYLGDVASIIDAEIGN